MSDTTQNRVERMVQAAAEVYGVEDWQTAFTTTRRRPYTLIRFAVWRVLYSRGWTMEAIGHAFDRDHGAVWHSMQARSVDPWFNEAVAAAHAVAMAGGAECPLPELEPAIEIPPVPRRDRRRKPRLAWVPAPLTRGA